MRRFRHGFAFVLIGLAAPEVRAEQIEAGFVIRDVTLYPDRALVVRHISFDAPVGRHTVIIPGLPEGTPAEVLRVLPPAGVQVLSSLVSQGRLPVVDPLVPEDVAAAEAEIARLKDAIRAAEEEIAVILLRAAAAEEQIRFLRGLGQGVPVEGLSPERLQDIRALSGLVGDLALEAETTAQAARSEAGVAERALEDLIAELARAEQALEVLAVERAESVSLILEVQVDRAGPVMLGLSNYTENASWGPTYDLSLNSETGALLVERAVVVQQSSGEDWRDVRLILSTANPGGQSAAGSAFGRLRQIISHEEQERLLAREQGRVAGFAAEIVEPPLVVVASTAPAGQFDLSYRGMTVEYTYPESVDLRDGVDSLRLDFGAFDLMADLRAEAVPARDETAFLMAGFENTTGEILLPGFSFLYRDGALVGVVPLQAVPAGGRAEVGFGPIDGLRLSRDVITQSEGEVGIVSTSNQRAQRVVMAIENLTARNWDVTVRDGTSYSQQDDLIVTVDASPAIDRADVDNRRGVVEWDLSIAAGETAEITVTETLEWPGDHDLR